MSDAATGLHDLTALDAAAAVRRREVSPTELVEHCLDRIDRLDGQIGAFVRLTPDTARTEARLAEDTIRSVTDPRELPALLGVPSAVKDLNAVRGTATSFGTAAIAAVVPDYDDYVVAKMRAAGLISLGKTATPEFGLPCYTETDIGPPARTPWDTGRLAGGSSGGAAAAVAAGFLPLAQGSDGGGSIRIPAAACGLVGLKTSRGRISRGPLDGDAAGLSVLGPLARTVRDAAAFLDAVAGPMPGDAYWAPPLPPGESFLAACERPPGRLRIGRHLGSPIPADVDPEIVAAYDDVSALLADLGHEVIDTEPALPPEAVPLFETVWSVGAASLPIPAEGEDQLRPLTRYLRERGRGIPGAAYVQALARLGQLARQGILAAGRFDAVLTPSVAQLPAPVGYFTNGGDPAEDFERQKRYTPYTAVHNMTGLPAISLPVASSTPGRPPEGAGVPLPIGVVLVGRQAGEAPLLSLAAQIEAARPWLDRHPPIWFQ